MDKYVVIYEASLTTLSLDTTLYNIVSIPLCFNNRLAKHHLASLYSLGLGIFNKISLLLNVTTLSSSLKVNVLLVNICSFSVSSFNLELE